MACFRAMKTSVYPVVIKNIPAPVLAEAKEKVGVNFHFGAVLVYICIKHT